MINSRKINIIVAVAVVFALMLSLALVGIANVKATNGSLKYEAKYASKIFGEDVISIEIIADEEDWQNMLDNAISEQFIMADVIVNGTKFQKVGIRPKGNSSLTQVAGSDSDRYSFRLQFNEYIKDQSCFGLESFVLNNMLGDNSYMKEYISYDLMREAGVDAPYFGFADIRVNGEIWGLYLAVELYNDSYEQRVYKDTSGMLYNVKSMDMGGGAGSVNPFAGGFRQREDTSENLPEQRAFNPGSQDFTVQDFPMHNFSPEDNQTENSRTQFAPRQGFPAMDFPGQMGDGNGMNDGFRGRGGFGSFGGSLEYIDDNTDSYSAIFNNVVGKGTESDYQRVVTALKALSEGKELEKYFNVDKILRYLAAHTIVVNLDSYSSNMAQNYYIYERNGQLTILPWDYNLAWGGFQNGSTSSVINFPIDTPLSGVDMSSRPLIEKLFANEEYLARYHGYLQQLIDNYFANGKFEAKINELDALISEYVKNDATKFCTYDEYKKAVSTFITIGNLRAESVQGQLDGTIPSTTAEQNANTDKLIKAEGISLSDLGSMRAGRGAGDNMNFPGMMGNGNRQFRGRWQNNEQMTPPDNTGQAYGNAQTNSADNNQVEQFGNIGQRRWPDNSGQGAWFGNINQGAQSGRIGQDTAAMSSGFMRSQDLTRDNLILIAALSLILILAIIFAAKYKRRC
jgi:spore coat protein CotH